MQLISSRAIGFLDSLSLAPGQAREALFRTDGDRFVLYLAGAILHRRARSAWFFSS